MPSLSKISPARLRQVMADAEAVFAKPGSGMTIANSGHRTVAGRKAGRFDALKMRRSKRGKDGQVMRKPLNPERMQKLSVALLRRAAGKSHHKAKAALQRQEDLRTATLSHKPRGKKWNSLVQQIQDQQKEVDRTWLQDHRFRSKLRVKLGRTGYPTNTPRGGGFASLGKSGISKLSARLYQVARGKAEIGSWKQHKLAGKANERKKNARLQPDSKARDADVAYHSLTESNHRLRAKKFRLQGEKFNNKFLSMPVGHIGKSNLQKISYQLGMRAIRRTTDKGVSPTSLSSPFRLRRDVIEGKVMNRLKAGKTRLAQRGIREPNPNSGMSYAEGMKRWNRYMDMAMREGVRKYDISKLSAKFLMRAGKKAGEEDRAFSDASNTLFGSKGMAGIKPTGKKLFNEMERLSNKRNKQASKFNRAGKRKMRAEGTLGKSDSGISKLSTKLLRRAGKKAGSESREFGNARMNLLDNRAMARGRKRHVGDSMSMRLQELSNKRYRQSNKFKEKVRMRGLGY